MRLHFSFLGLLLFASLACNAPDNNVVNCEFDQEAMLTNYADEIIIPRFENFDLGISLLESSFMAFVANPTVGLLNEVRIAYGTTYLGYQGCSMFGFGPALINGESFRARFNTFPTNTTLIDQSIAANTPVANCPNSAVGFPALDYLLFGTAGTTDSEMVTLFTTDADASKRVAFVTELISELKNTQTVILQGWMTYRTEFISNTGTAAGTSIATLVNDFNYDFETLKNFKFKIPLGKFNGGIVLPATVEGFYVGRSSQLAEEHVKAFHEVYKGIGFSGTDGLGLYEFVECLNPSENDELSLADEIDQQLTAVLDAVRDIPDPMSETLISNKPIVDEAHTQMQMLVPLIKHEMTSSMSVQINYQDNDGD